MYNNSIESAKMLLEQGCEILPDNKGITPIHCAALMGMLLLCVLLTCAGRERALSMILMHDKAKALIDAPEFSDDNTALHFAAHKGTGILLDRCNCAGHIKCVNLLLSLGAKIRAQDKKGNTAAHKATLAGQDDTCKHEIVLY